MSSQHLMVMEVVVEAPRHTLGHGGAQAQLQMWNPRLREGRGWGQAGVGGEMMKAETETATQQECQSPGLGPSALPAAQGS